MFLKIKHALFLSTERLRPLPLKKKFFFHISQWILKKSCIFKFTFHFSFKHPSIIPSIYVSSSNLQFSLISEKCLSCKLAVSIFSILISFSFLSVKMESCSIWYYFLGFVKRKNFAFFALIEVKGRFVDILRFFSDIEFYFSRIVKIR